MDARPRGALQRWWPALALALAVLAVAAVLLARPREPSGDAAAGPTPGATASAPRPSATASAAAPSPSATPSATGAAPAGRFVNAQLGYSIDLQPPWHRWDCGSFPLRTTPPRDGLDEFVALPDREIVATDTGLHVDHVGVFARENSEGLTPRQWIAAGRVFGGAVGQSVEDTTLSGRPALLLRGTESEIFLVADGTTMYQVWHEHPAASGPATPAATRAAILRSFHILTADEQRAALAAATPRAQQARSPEQVADTLAEGFAKKDVAILARVITPSCVSLGAAQAGGTAVDDERYLDDLRARFAAGLSVTVEPRPLEGSRAGDLPTLTVRSVWREPGRADQDVDLMISPDGATWYWRGTIAYLGGRR